MSLLDFMDMTGTRAPLFEEIARAPAGGVATWLTASDGVRIRAAHWGRDTARRGTVLLFPGRTEYVEKYGHAIGDLVEAGLAVLTLDWRGQGIATRVHPNPALGHVGSFADYQRDVAALVAHARAEALPEPWFLIAHSMGGCIGLRSLMQGLPVRAAAFSAPMWGIRMSPALRPVAWGLSSVSRPLGFSTLLAPGQQEAPYVLRARFEVNSLTSDPEMFAMMRDQLAARPDLALGGPSLNWLNEALREMRALLREAAPPTPAIAFVGSDEQIVDPGRIRARIASWPGARLTEWPGARHEVLMERPATRGAFLDAALTHFGGVT